MTVAIWLLVYILLAFGLGVLVGHGIAFGGCGDWNEENDDEVGVLDRATRGVSGDRPDAGDAAHSITVSALPPVVAGVDARREAPAAVRVDPYVDTEFRLDQFTRERRARLARLQGRR